MFTRIYSLLPLVVAAAIGVVSVAASAAEVPTIKVAYNDLDLSRSDDVSKLYQRVQRAAMKYCKDTRASTGTRISPAFDACLQDAIDTTVQKIGRPELSALHTSRIQQPGGNS